MLFTVPGLAGCLFRLAAVRMDSPAPPPNPTAAEPRDGRVLSRPSSRVHEPRNSPDAVVLRSQTVLTGSGSHRYSYGGFGGGHPRFRPHTDRRTSALAAPSTWDRARPCGDRVETGWRPSGDGTESCLQLGRPERSRDRRSEAYCRAVSRVPGQWGCVMSGPGIDGSRIDQVLQAGVKSGAVPMSPRSSRTGTG